MVLVPLLFTIGHSDHVIDRFVDLLKLHTIAVVADVRSRPRSRNREYNGDRLRLRLRRHKIDYLRAGDILGGIGAMPNTDDPRFMGNMRELIEISRTGPVALMCSEGKPSECHRATKLTAWLHRNTDLQAIHIMRDGTTVGSREYEPTIKRTAMWHEFGGRYGAPAKAS